MPCRSASRWWRRGECDRPIPSPISPTRTWSHADPAIVPPCDCGQASTRTASSEGRPAGRPHAPVNGCLRGGPDALVQREVRTLVVGPEERLGLGDECLPVDMLDLDNGSGRVGAPTVEDLFGL